MTLTWAMRPFSIKASATSGTASAMWEISRTKSTPRPLHARLLMNFITAVVFSSMCSSAGGVG